MASKKRRAHNKLKQKQELAANSSQSRFGGRSENFGYRLTGGYHGADLKRDVWTVAGYPAHVDFDMHWAMQARFGIAKAGIHLLPNKCWQSHPVISDGENDGEREQTPFEKDVETLVKKFDLFARLKGMDWRNRIGRYAGIIPIVKESGENLDPTKPSTRINGIEALIKIVPVPESQISVTDVGTNSDISSENYGMPKYYNFRQNVSGDRNPIDNTDIKLDPSRVFVMAEGADDGSIFGIPANEAGYNSLMDLEKICVAGSEGLFKNSKQRTVINVKDGQVANVLTNDKEKKEQWDKSADDFASGFDSMLTTYGMDVNSLQSTLSDPTAPFTNSLNCYAASIQTPASEIVGVQMNKQASVGNETAFINTAESRRENTLSPMIIRFLEYFVERGIIKAPSTEIIVTWDALSQPTVGEKLDNSKKMAEVNKQAFDTGMQEPVFTEEEIRKGLVFEEKPDNDDDFKMPGEGDDDDPKETDS